MIRRILLLSTALLPFALVLFALVPFAASAESDHVLPAPRVDMPPASGLQTATFAGGCFWGVQAVFEHTKGVTRAVAGYAGGTADSPTYRQVSTGSTGHTESVRVTFDPAVVSYGTLLQIFFTVALDPTLVNLQGPDHGTQYRSELFVTGPDQERVARAYIAQLDAAHEFPRPIATRVDPAGAFWVAEDYHQDYFEQHLDSPYIATYDVPKVDGLLNLFPRNWRQAPVTVGQLAANP